jgi:hypothetical protein
MSCETNLLKENNRLKSKVKNLNNKLERCYNSQVTFEYMLKNKRRYGDKSGLGFNKDNVGLSEVPKITHSQLLKSYKRYGNMNGIRYNNTNIKGKKWGKRKYEKEMKRLEEERLSHLMCFQCNKMGHLARTCPNKEESQPKPQDEQEKKPQDQVKINHEDIIDDLKMKKKKKTRRGGRARHPTPILDAKMMMSKNQEKKDLAHIKCFKCEEMGHYASRCPTKLRRRLKQLKRGKAMKSIT